MFWFLLAPLLASPAGAAIEVQNQLVSTGVAADTGNGPSTPRALNSSDGRFVLLASDASNLVAGATDTNALRDVFLYDRVANSMALVSRSAADPTRSANGYSEPLAITPDGAWVLFYSGASNLVAGVTDANGAQEDLFLYQRSTGSVSLVSRAASSATMTANGATAGGVVSADGNWVLFTSSASNLVAGVSDGNFSQDVFLFQRSTGAVSLVTRSSASAATTANSGSGATAISVDGEWVLFLSSATNLVAGVTDSNGALDVFLFQRSTGAVTLVSRSSASATTTGNASSQPVAITGDGQWVLFGSNATNLVAFASDVNGAQSDAFVYQRSTGMITLISRVSPIANVTGNAASQPVAITPDGEWVLFNSSAVDLVPGVNDANGNQDVFLHQRSTGTSTLVSRAGSTAFTAFGFSNAASLSSDGQAVLFTSTASNVDPFVVDNNGGRMDVFLFRRLGGFVTTVSTSGIFGPWTASDASDSAAMSADGQWVLLRSKATDLVVGVTDSAGSNDVFLFPQGFGQRTLVTRAAFPASTPTTGNGYTLPQAVSSDGDWVLQTSIASNLVAGVDDRNETEDAFLYRRSTGATTLLSRAAGAPSTTPNSSSRPQSMSADAEWVLFSSNATNIVAGVTDTNGSQQDVFLHQRSTGAVTLVSRSAASPTSTANALSSPIAISNDGEWVLFSSSASNLVGGITDGNGTTDVFLFQRSTGAVTLVSRAAGTSTTGNNFSIPVALSPDGEWVLFRSPASNLVAGVIDGNSTEDVFLYRRSTGVVSLVSRAAGSPTTTANALSFPVAITGDGEWVLLRSSASNLVPGVTDTNANLDVFLYQRSTGAMTLVTRAAASPTTAANSFSNAFAMSSDGEWVLLHSNATDLVAGITDANATQDVFLYQRSTGAMRLVSRAGASASATANGVSSNGFLSADGEWGVFASRATDLVAGMSDANGTQEDVFVFRRSTGEVALVSRTAASATTSTDFSAYPVGISADGRWALFGTAAADVVAGALDGNGNADGFLGRILDRIATTATIAATVPDPSLVGQAVVVDVTVAAAGAAPTDGTVTLAASTGETCTDATPAAGSGATALFSCAITFSTVGPRSLTATFRGSATHADSNSAGEPHAVATTLNLLPASLPGGTFGVAYSQTVVASGAGSSAPYAYAIGSGALPNGLLLDAASGALSGTPTAAGSFAFQVTATDSSAPAVGGPFTGARSYTIDIARANQAALTASASPSGIVFGGSSVLATSGGTGTGAVTYAVTAGASFCTISGNTLTGTGVGTCAVTATKAADANYNAATATVDVTVARAGQATLTATANPTSIAFGGSSALATTGGSGTGAVSFAVTAGASFCSVGGNTLTGTGVGTCTVTATKAADANYNAATATVEVTVTRAEQATLTATASPTSIVFGGATTLTTTGGSGTGAVTFAVTAGASFCAVDGSTLTGTGVGTCTVTATKAADANYNVATAAVDVTVARANQAALTATATPSSILFGATSTLSTTGGSGTGAVTFAVTAGTSSCAISGNTLTGTGVGTCAVTATKAADANYNVATATVDVTVQAATDLEVSVTDGTQYAVPGSFVEYTILVANAGPLSASGARLQNAVPAGLADALWTCAPVQGASCTSASGTGAIDQLLNLPPAGVLRYVFSARVNAAVGATINNSASITPPAGLIEADPADNTSTDSNTVVPDGLFGNGFEPAGPVISVPIRGP